MVPNYFKCQYSIFKGMRNLLAIPAYIIEVLFVVMSSDIDTTYFCFGGHNNFWNTWKTYKSHWTIFILTTRHFSNIQTFTFLFHAHTVAGIGRIDGEICFCEGHLCNSGRTLQSSFSKSVQPPTMAVILLYFIFISFSPYYTSLNKTF